MAARFVAFAAFVAVAKAGIIGAPAAYSSIGSPLLAHGLAAPAISSLGYGIAGRAISPLGLASPAIASYGAPLGLAPRLAAPAIASYGSPLGLAPRLAAPAIASYGSPLGLAPRLAAPAIASYGAPIGLAPRLAAPAIASYGAPIGVAPRLASPVLAKTVAAVDTDYDPNPSYSYAYDVQDALTGDNKNQQESRQGDVVQGSYSLTEPDGTRRTVEYTADPVNGFNAVVHREPLAVAKAVVAAPAYARVASPLAYAAGPGLTQTIIH